MMTNLVAQRRSSQQRGFTLIELLVVIAIISVLIGLLLLAMQKVRLTAPRMTVKNNHQSLVRAAQIYGDVNGVFPATLGDLANFCATHPEACRPLAGFPFGPTEGYTYFFTDATATTWNGHAEPAFPGVTGNVSLAIDQTGSLTESPTPGADEAEERMFDNIRAEAADTVADLLNLDSSAASQVRDFVESGNTVPDAFARLDANGDGLVTFEEILDFDRDRSSPLGRFLAIVGTEMKLGAANENVSALPGVTLSSLQGDPGALFFSFDGLCSLTKQFVSQDGIAVSLCAKLDAAKAAASAGDLGAKQGAFQAYENEISAQAGKTLTFRRAITLMTLAKTL